jgi:hypothetical protein
MINKPPAEHLGIHQSQIIKKWERKREEEEEKGRNGHASYWQRQSIVI